MAARAENPIMEARWFPRNVFSSIITKACVEDELRKAFPGQTSGVYISRLAHDICSRGHGRDRSQGKGYVVRYRRIFAILVLIKKTRAIEDFIEEGVSDSHLPLMQIARPNEGMIFDLRLRCEPSRSITNLFRDWDDADIEQFWSTQWAMIAPFFATNKAHNKVWHYSLKKKAILPFERIDGGAGQVRSGGFGQVSRVYIHPEHHNFRYDATGKRASYSGSFARKQLHSSLRETFDKEVEMLKKFSNDAHAHLVSLLVTYEQNGQFFLLFDWAQCNLKEYWEMVDPTPSANDQETVLWMGKQCKGIADGILRLHRYRSISGDATEQATIFGHHGDIKEENILWFPADDAGPGPAQDAAGARRNTGVLKLADFGVAGFSEHNTSSMDGEAHFIASPSYRAPESDVDRRNCKGRSYDIWTLGCLYLQFITWLLGGRDLLKDFKKKRTCEDPGWSHLPVDNFFMRDADNSSLIVKPVVSEVRTALLPMSISQHPPAMCRHIFTDTAENRLADFAPKFIESLRRHQYCTQFLSNFLDLIETQMLVVKKNDLKDRGRIAASELYAELNRMVQLCHTNKSYGCDPIPRS